MYNAESESQCRAWVLGDNNVSVLNTAALLGHMLIMEEAVQVGIEYMGSHLPLSFAVNLKLIKVYFFFKSFTVCKTQQTTKKLIWDFRSTNKPSCAR